MLAAALVILALGRARAQSRTARRRSPARARWCWSSTTAGLRLRNGPARTSMIERLIAEAEGQSRPVMIVPTANAAKSIAAKVGGADGGPFHRSGDAAATVRAGSAGGRAGDRQRARKCHQRKRGLAHRRHRSRRDNACFCRPAKARWRVLALPLWKRGRVWKRWAPAPRSSAGGRLEAQVLRAEGGPRSGTLHAMSARGQRLGEVPFSLNEGRRAPLPASTCRWSSGTR